MSPDTEVTQRDRKIRRIVLIEGAANLSVSSIKAYVGFTTGSLAVLGDAVHSLTDLANNIIAWFVLKMAAAPPDREHPYGHRKMEILAVFVLATLLTVLAWEIILNAVSYEASPPETSGWGLGLMILVLFVNFGLAVWERYWARRLTSEILQADASHTFADVLTTVVVLVGWQLSSRGYPWLDSLCAFGVAVLILYLAFGLFKRAIPVLTDHMAIDPELLAETVIRVPGVMEVHRIRSRWIGAERAVDMTIVVDRKLGIAESHRIADAVERTLEQELKVDDITIHMEPHIE